jgi:tetratricopeptide (TPR) repeat protein
MNKSQIATIIFFLGLFLTLYFGCETKSVEQIRSEKSRALNFENISPNTLVDRARSLLSDDDKAYIQSLEFERKQAQDDSTSLFYLEQLASNWYARKHEEVSGIYAQEIAEKTDTEDAWSITGTTFALCVQRTQDADIKEFCFNRATKAFEKAISFNPENVEHQVNLALVYVEKPLEENPMKGIMMLLDLNKKFPENITVLNQLGKLGFETNQLEKAIGRFTKVLSIDPQNRDANCFLYQIYSKQGNESLAKKHLEECNRTE